MSEVPTQKKRKYFDGNRKNKRGKFGVTNRRPKRGSPGILLTCETGRERKCQREGLEILNYYLTTSDMAATSDNGSSQDDGDGTIALSLEEELKLLKKKKEQSEPSAFGVYDTSCRGTVFILCTLSNCNLIPPIQTEYMLSKKSEIAKSGPQLCSENSKNAVRDSLDNVSNTKIKSETVCAERGKIDEAQSRSLTKDKKDNDGTPVVQETPPWDPISTVRTIISDIDNDSNRSAPRSRFVTRMIPIQATCFASSEELQLTCSEVLKRYMSRTTKTFAIVFKKRHCNNLNRALVIKIVGETMSKLFPDCKVQLDKPDSTILVEVCETLCGISVIENCQDYHKFNLIRSSTGKG